MILGDNDLKTYIESGKLRISNMTPKSVRENGVDCCIGDTYAIDTLITDYLVDTHDQKSVEGRFIKGKFSESNGSIIIPPLTNILLVTEERFMLPDDLMAFCGAKSTIARTGFVPPITIVDAGFSNPEATLTIEAFYGGKNPIKIYKGDRFLHVIFAKLNTPCKKPYRGTYTGQIEVRLPKTMD